MNALEEIHREENSLRQAQPIVIEIQHIYGGGRSIPLRVKKAEAVRHDPVRDCRGYVIHVTLDECCLDKDQLKTIMNIEGFSWITLWGGQLRIDFWRKEI